MPPPLSPATTIRSGSMFSLAALAFTHFSPETQSFRPAGKGSTSGAEEAVRQLRKSTMATATPMEAMIRPQERYMPSKADELIMPPPWM